ncbi:MAG: SDR family oxidoreductase [Gaiellaceae bacterium]
MSKLALSRKARLRQEALCEVVFRPLAHLVVLALAPLRVPPPAVVLASAAFGIAGAVELARGQLVVAALLVQAKTVFDNADGQLARLTGRTSAFGRYLDSELDLLVNAAGEGFAPRAVEELTEGDWDAAFGATAKGSFFVTQAAAPHLRASRGCVVMIEDVAAYEPWPSFAAHSAAKAAQAMLTRVLARALAPEVRVCGVVPGPVAVEPGQEERRAAETLLGRVGSPEDVAGAVAYLAGADFVTGATLVVDGGRLLQSMRPGPP